MQREDPKAAFRHDLRVKSLRIGSRVYPDFSFHTCTTQREVEQPGGVLRTVHRRLDEEEEREEEEEEEEEEERERQGFPQIQLSMEERKRDGLSREMAAEQK
ncbi:unnamed protein product [Pleuronectes platessa]|uniref:Uncharacterized protein n=1 Tax=Pleuronectes platessa TaxID=8262 RepID=A0A9N7Y769_PLEPL|nr:unnamed protein product [Pleuronectes platessa]